MKTNKLDNSIKEKFANRTLEPSASAWERLSVKLEEQPKQKKKGWFFYIGYAASILVLISIGIYTFSEDKQVIVPKQMIVEEKTDTAVIKNKIEQHFSTISIEKAIVKSKKVTKKLEVKMEITKNVLTNKTKNVIPTKEESLNAKFNKNDYKAIITKINEKNTIVIPTKKESKTKQETNSRIKVNADDLLYAATNKLNEVENQNTKQHMSSAEILKTIKSELKKSNLKVNPETILAEVERTIDKDVFQNNFLKSLKKRISNIATAIASRNH